jgi:subtilase family serine protease
LIRKYRLLGLVFVLAVFVSFALQSGGQNNEPDEVILPILFGPQVQAAPVGLTPAQVRRAYGFDQLTNRGAGQTIAVVSAFDQPYIEEDLAVFNQTFSSPSLPPCTTANGCFRKITTTKNNTKPAIRQVWALESSLSVEWAHAIAPDARILLVETKSAKLAEVMEGVDLAVQNGATIVSMSWGVPEFAGQVAYDSRLFASNVTFIAGSGDFGTGVLYPAASPNVIGVGGTTLNVDLQGNYISETALSASGGGQSAFEAQPPYQMQFGIPNNPDGKRGVPDVAYNADFASAFAVYSSFPYLGFKGWIPVAGTSAGAPQWAGLFAIANSMRIEAGKSPFTGGTAALYRAATLPGLAKFHDIITGSNGSCGSLCDAGLGFDYVTGLGSPRADRLVPALVAGP